MSHQIVLIAECPYCEQSGEIYCDVREAGPEHLQQIPEFEFSAGPDQRIILFNSDRAEPGPCEHVVHIYGDIDWVQTPNKSSERNAGEKTFTWRAPILTEIDPDRLAWEQLQDLFEGESRQMRKSRAETTKRSAPDGSDTDASHECAEEEYEPYYETDYLDAAPDEFNLYAYRPQTKYQERSLGNSWQDFSSEGKPIFYEVGGRIIFAEDIRQFFEELHAGLEKRNRDLQSKQTT